MPHFTLQSEFLAIEQAIGRSLFHKIKQRQEPPTPTVESTEPGESVESVESLESTSAGASSESGTSKPKGKPHFKHHKVRESKLK